MKVEEIINKLKKKSNPKNVAGMARFGISSKNTLGVSVVTLRAIGKDIKKETKDKDAIHKLALELWKTEIHEARILATIIDIPELVSENQADSWVKDLDSWDTCDQFCMNLMNRTSFAFKKVTDWANRDEEFVRRAGFALVAALTVRDKTATDKQFEKFFPLIKKYSTDERNFVRKAVNWALRQTGKRNKTLLPKAIKLAEEIEKIDSKSARWIAKDALRELRAKI